MNNEMLIVFHALLVLLTLTICAMAFIKDRGRPVSKHLTLLSLIILGWQLAVIALYATDNTFLARYLYDAKLVFVAYSPVQLYILSHNFYIDKSDSRRFSRFFPLLLIIPTITSVLALTSPLHNLIRVELSVVEMEPLRTFKNVRGLWFWVHSVYCYIIMLLSATPVLTWHKKLLKAYRTPSSLLIAGIVVALFSNIIVISGAYTYDIDISLVGISLALPFVYVAINANDQSGFLVLAREKIFSYMSDYIFILDGEYAVIDCNTSAKHWMTALGIKQNSLSFYAIARKFIDADEKDVEAMTEDSNLDVDMKTDDRVVSYNLRKLPIQNKYGKLGGFLIAFTDVTRYKVLIDEQSKMAGIDPLTNLGNRRRCEQVKYSLDIPENLPFSVIMGDANRLKSVNDTLGHQMGDSLLRLIANVLSDSCPNSGSVYRIGGDEFLLLLPNTSNEETDIIIQTIQKTMNKIERYPFKPSVALGSATKTCQTQNLDTVIKTADTNMYKNKESQRLIKT